MGTQKPGEWANTLIARFEEQVRLNNNLFEYMTAFDGINIFFSFLNKTLHRYLIHSSY